jgi:cytochrome c biogenesis factor
VDSFGRPTFQPSTEVAIRSDIQEDLYAVFAGAVDGTEEAVYRFSIIPLVWWIWYGGGLLALGGLITMWPGASTPGDRRQQAGYGASLADREMAGTGA